MAKLVYYGDLLSEPARSVFMFLKINNIPFEYTYIDLLNRKHCTDEYEKVNPFKLVPAIDDGGFKLAESVAILEYLADKHNVPDHWFPKDLKKRAKVNAYTSWHHSNIKKYTSLYFDCMFLQPKFTGKPVDKERRAQVSEQLDGVLNLVEKIYLSKPGTYLAGEEAISIADLMLLNEILQVKCFDFDLFKGRPRLESWMGRTIQRLGPVYEETCVDIFKLAKQFKAE